MPEKILIISYLFPPSKGIGGRRWAKIAKHWARLGNDVKVIASLNPKDVDGPWNNDVESLKQTGKITYTQHCYPDILNYFGNKTFLQELQYRWALARLKLKSKGNYYDRSIVWADKILPLVVQMIKQGYTQIVATGAPFYYLEKIVALKKQFPELKVWIDLRDPWTWGKSYGINSLSNNRRNFELRNEQFVIENADVVSVPVISMKKELERKYKSVEVKLLPHFYDPDDIPLERNKDKNLDFDIIYAGTVYSSIEDKLLNLAGEMLKIETQGKKIRWRFFVNFPDKLKKVFSDRKYGFIEINHVVSSRQILQEISNADYYIAVYPEKFKDHLSTKFPEILAVGTPIIYVGEEGSISRFIETNKMGFVIADDIGKGFLSAIRTEPNRTTKDSSGLSIQKIVGNTFSEHL